MVRSCALLLFAPRGLPCCSFGPRPVRQLYRRPARQARRHGQPSTSPPARTATDSTSAGPHRHAGPRLRPLQNRAPLPGQPPAPRAVERHRQRHAVNVTAAPDAAQTPPQHLRQRPQHHHPPGPRIPPPSSFPTSTPAPWKPSSPWPSPKTTATSGPSSPKTGRLHRSHPAGHLRRRAGNPRRQARRRPPPGRHHR